ncbi:MAG: nuclear transport factor 2 family protein [Chitinophagaceae bacterium]|nr:nuclear transport factor 2 family protein [Chitinophagaceae bacterium]
MNTNEIATRLAELCRQGQYETAHKELYAEDAVSIEQEASPAFAKETKGLDAIIEKAHKWESMVQEVHKLSVSAPVVADNSFACTMYMDITMKESGRIGMTELCVYKVKDGKIVSEQFFM